MAIVANAELLTLKRFHASLCAIRHENLWGIVLTDFYHFLSSNQITYQRHDHPAVYTVEEADRLVPKLPAAKTKNLFLRDDKGKRHILALVRSTKRVDLKRLKQLLGIKRISFGSPQRLKSFLGIEPGAVSLLAVYNDPDHRVEVVMDRELWQADTFQFHPLVNTSTLVIGKPDVERFLKATGHRLQLMDIPSSEPS